MRYEFCEGSEGKDVRGSLEGGAVHDHDPLTCGEGGPMGGEQLVARTGYEFLTHSISE